MHRNMFELHKGSMLKPELLCLIWRRLYVETIYVKLELLKPFKMNSTSPFISSLVFGSFRKKWTFLCGYREWYEMIDFRKKMNGYALCKTKKKKCIFILVFCMEHGLSYWLHFIGFSISVSCLWHFEKFGRRSPSKP